MIAATELKILARGLAPCCDFRTVLPLSARQAAVSLAHDELRLAVTDTATAGGAAGKTRLLAPNPGPHPQTLPPAQTGALASLATGCGARCRRLAAREDLRLPTAVNWAGLEAEGRLDAVHVRRVELIRPAFSHTLERWLTADLA